MKAFARAVVAGTALSLLAGPLGAQQRTIPDPVQLDIKAQPIVAALSAWAQQTGFQLILPESIVPAGIVSKPLLGKLEPEAALRLLLSDTALDYEFLDSRTVAVSLRVNTSSVGAASPIRLARTTDRPALPARSDDGRIEEIVVTARKRTESLGDVPISIAVLTSSDIEKRGLVNAADYLRDIPGVNQVDSAVGQSIVIRGIESSLGFQNFNSGTTVATYFGEAPTTNSAGLGGGTNIDIKLVDVERVEVLRGPQGTAFGNSSMGGAVRTIPTAPKLDRIEGRVAGGYSVTAGSGGDSYNLQAVANLPLIEDMLAVRATAYRFEDAGFYNNRAGSDAEFRASAVTPFGAEGFAFDRSEVGASDVFGGRIAARLEATEKLRFTLSYLTQKSEVDGFALANSGRFDQTLLQVAPEHVVRGRRGGAFDTDIDIANAIAEYDFGWASLLGTYSYIESGSIRSLPYTYADVDLPLSARGDSKHRENVGELRLTTQLPGAWNFLAGLYTEELKDRDFIENLWHGDPAINFFNPGAREAGVNLDRRRLTQTAAFGEASWQFVENWTLTGGVRVYDYERTYRNDASGALYGDVLVDEKADASGENFRANLSYKPSESTLVYAGWSQGFRLGRPQTGLPAGVCDANGDGLLDGGTLAITDTRSVNSDTVDSYELGGKFVMLERRFTVEADVFRMDWNDMPVSAVSTCNTIAYSYLANAGTARSEGVELQARLQLVEALRLDFGGSYTHARLTQDVPGLGARDGDRLPGSPEVNANLGLQYEFGIARYDAQVRADAMYVGSFHGDLTESATLEAGDYVKVDTSLRVTAGQLNLDLFIRNLTNQDAFTFRGSNAAVGEFFGYRLRPRTIGLQLGYAF